MKQKAKELEQFTNLHYDLQFNKFLVIPRIVVLTEPGFLWNGRRLCTRCSQWAGRAGCPQLARRSSICICVCGCNCLRICALCSCICIFVFLSSSHIARCLSISYTLHFIFWELLASLIGCNIWFNAVQICQKSIGRFAKTWQPFIEKIVRVVWTCVLFMLNYIHLQNYWFP